MDKIDNRKLAMAFLRDEDEIVKKLENGESCLNCDKRFGEGRCIFVDKKSGYQRENFGVCELWG